MFTNSLEFSPKKLIEFKLELRSLEPSCPCRAAYVTVVFPACE
jgi:hypothetical protein